MTQCVVCKRKIISCMTLIHTCKCKNIYCNLHMHDHNCTFDYKENWQNNSEKCLPTFKPEKIKKI
jgi:hypothetical protein